MGVLFFCCERGLGHPLMAGLVGVEAEPVQPAVRQQPAAEEVGLPDNDQGLVIVEPGLPVGLAEEGAVGPDGLWLAMLVTDVIVFAFSLWLMVRYTRQLLKENLS